jgi:hypothetical protein
MEMQTEGFIAMGDLPNEERYPCLMCRNVPDRVRVDVFVPEPSDIPGSVSLPNSKALVFLYRLCPRCYETKPDAWKIRLLMLERLTAMTEGL